MNLIRQIILISLLFAGLSLRANSFLPSDQFSLVVLNVNHGTFNTNVLLEFSAGKKIYPIEITVRKDGSRMIVFSKKGILDLSKGNNKTFYSQFLNLQSGNYQVSAEISDFENQVFYYQEFSFHSNPPTEQPWLSDIRFFTCPDEKPLVSENLVGKFDMLHFQADLRSPKDELLAARAVLFRKDESGSGLPKFVSVEQISSVLDPVRSSVFENDFTVKGLEPGEYLVELYLYRREKLFLAVNRSFRIRWPGLKPLFENPDSAFWLMAPVCSTSLLDSLLKLPTIEKKKNALIHYWTKMNPPGISFQSYALEGYFARLSEGVEQFPQASQPWENDRLKTWLSYGQPDLRKSVINGNIETEIWFYKAWGLKIRFRKESGLWKLIA